ncbi:MAG: calcium-binding protein [Gemmobacter sp.]
MPVATSIPDFVVNTGFQGGSQINSRTVGLANGGTAVLWQDSLSASQIYIRIFDGLGNATGGPTAVVVGNLADVIETVDGRIAVASISAGGATMQVNFLSATTGVSQGSASGLPIGGGSVSGVQIVAAADGGVTGLATSSVTGTSRFEVDVGNPNFLNQAVVSANGTGSPVREVLDVGGGVMFGLLQGDTLVSSPSGATSIGGLGLNDLIQVEPGFFIAIADSNTVTNTPILIGVTGETLNAQDYGAGPPISGAVTGGSVQTGATTYDHQLVNLGDGRILLVFASFAGAAGSASSGIYASVYNRLTGAAEGFATLLRGIGSMTDLTNLRLSAELMADGRVAVTYSAPNGIGAFDIFHTMLDTREDGIAVAGSAAADAYVGTAFDDTFTSINFNDRIFGGNGNDTVVLSGSNPRTVDLADPDAFAGLGPFLDGIENVTGTSATDTFYGNALANRLDGGNGNDVLVGRAGDDVLLGGVGDDTLDGGADNDRLDGGSNDDRLLGRDGNDSLYGGTGDDQVLAGTGDDLVQGGDGNDVLNGGTGNDTILGGIGNDTIVTGAGDDLVQAGDGNDLIHIDSLGAHLILGEGGIDTVSFARLPSGSTGPVVHVDLAGLVDPLASAFGFDEPVASFSGVENVIGSAVGDFIAGDGAANRLSGGSGNDVVVGRGGADTLTGGEGADTFVFNAPGDGADSLRDFTVGEDVIALVLGGFGDIDAGNIATRFVPSAAPSPAANSSAQLLFDNSGAGAGRLLFDADGNGAGVAVLVATLTFATPGGLAAFGAADFIFV